jgi:YggT family protein
VPVALQVLDQVIAVLKVAFFWLAVVAAVLFALDWAVRTRRIDPSSGLARFLRKYIDPMIVPVERRVVRAGGMPASAPWWTLVAVVVGAILVLWILDFIRGEVGNVAMGMSGGAVGLLVILINWTFSILQIAILLRVLASWIGFSTYSKWMRWTVVVSEPILRPLRQIIPTIGFIDITPLVAFFLLRIVQNLLITVLLG